jgi:hypothetical protein
MNKIRLIIVLSTLLVACSTKTIFTTPATSLKLVGDTVIVNVTGQNIEANTLDQFTREIKAQLLIVGFDIDKETDKKINPNVLVTAFTPGNAGLRLTVGFGAGRGSLLYVAEYKNNKGQTLAKMDGQERFTGAEVGFNQHYGGFTALGGEETAATVLLKEAAKHIVELALKQ